jgi:DUF1365 family protein
MPLTSSLIVGKVMHQRLRPVLHRFVYPIFFLRINLAETGKMSNALFGINRLRPISLYFKDYGPRDGSDLLQWMQQLLEQHGIDDHGDIFLQTMPRLFGYAFNPISIWYCHNRQGQLVAVLTEVNNTFGEHHLYLLRTHDDAPIRGNSTLISTKMMHVSPFCEVKGSYAFRFRENRDTCLVKIDYNDTAGILINTAISAKKLAFNKANLIKTLLGQPLLTIGVICKIHWQALLLWRKRVPFFRQPAPAESQITLSHSPRQEPPK